MVTAGTRYETPETLKRLQLLFDEIWAELAASGSPHAAPEAAVAARDRLAQLVVQKIGEKDWHAAGIKREILALFGADEA